MSNAFGGWPFDRENALGTASNSLTPKGDAGTLSENQETKPSLTIGTTVIKNFILIEANEEMEERTQGVDTFGITYMFFLGRKPRIFSYTILLMDTFGSPWKDDLMYKWETSLRGSASIANSTPVTLSYNKVTRTGYLLNLRVKTRGDAQPLATASFSMLVSQTIANWP